MILQEIKNTFDNAKCFCKDAVQATKAGYVKEKIKYMHKMDVLWPLIGGLIIVVMVVGLIAMYQCGMLWKFLLIAGVAIPVLWMIGIVAVAVKEGVEKVNSFNG